MITLSLACNDPRTGRFLGRFEFVQFSDDSGTLVELYGPQSTVAFAYDHSVPRVFVADKWYQLVSGRERYAGNYAWDSAGLHLVTARFLLGRLLQLGFEPVEWVESGPLADLVRKATGT